MAIKQTAAGFKVAAWAADGTVEGIEAAAGAFAAGVQWHPEGLIERLPLQLCLFRWIVQEAQK